MVEEKIVIIGRATLDNIRKGVTLLKKAVKSGRKEKPSVVVFKSFGKSELYVGIIGETTNLKAVKVSEVEILVEFTEDAYLVMARKTENVLEISKVIQRNAEDKLRSLQNTHRIPYQEYEDLLYNIGDFLEDDNSLNVVYSQGVGSFDAYDYIHVEDMVEAVRAELMSNKTIKGVQVRGIPRVQLYIQVKDANNTTVSFSYLGEKDNVYETIDWNGRDNLKDIFNDLYDEARYYDSKLKTSKLDKDVGGYTHKTVATKSVRNMSDDEYKEVLEDY